ncbi:hypothetical protein K0U07_00460 [bacterium]|nr:hypothetical protein [bacterium]
MSDLIASIAKDLQKVEKGNKLASQRIRCATIELSKVSKKWRKLSIEREKKGKK